MNLSLFLARRLYYYKGEEKKRASLPAIRIATLGVAVGLAVMILSVAIVLGFKNVITSKVTGLDRTLFCTIQECLIAEKAILLRWIKFW